MNIASPSSTPSVIAIAAGLVLLGIGLFTGMHGATAIGLILAVFFGIRWLRNRSSHT
jgi:hypothetical protein